MPTSSQAMIVMSGEGEDPRIPRRRYGGSSEFSVANYDMELALRLKNIGFLNQGVSGTGLPAPSADSMASVLKALSKLRVHMTQFEKSTAGRFRTRTTRDDLW